MTKWTSVVFSSVLGRPRYLDRCANGLSNPAGPQPPTRQALLEYHIAHSRLFRFCSDAQVRRGSSAEARDEVAQPYKYLKDPLSQPAAIFLFNGAPLFARASAPSRTH